MSSTGRFYPIHVVFVQLVEIMKVAIIGGGAAGFFSAIACKEKYPDAQVTIYEKTTKLLSKVKVSGGGRCNLTNACHSPVHLAANYPRGGNQLKKLFVKFGPKDTIHWFESHGVPLKSEPDNRVFPCSDDSQSIIDCLINKARQLRINILIRFEIIQIEKLDDKYIINRNIQVDHVIVTAGGQPKIENLHWIKNLGLDIITPVPSLFTFNMPDEPVKELMGLTINHATVKVQKTNLKAEGPILITHWGMSGPAILKLSAFGARELNDISYNFRIQINWTGKSEHELRKLLAGSRQNDGKKKVVNRNPLSLPNRLWEFLFEKTEVRSDIQWGELGKKGLNKIVDILINDVYQVSGKTTFKEEFVTCGGVSLQSIDMSTMQSKACPGLFFAGEVLDIDGITGGFNFQAAWTTGYIAGQLGS